MVFSNVPLQEQQEQVDVDIDVSHDEAPLVADLRAPSTRWPVRTGLLVSVGVFALVAFAVYSQHGASSTGVTKGEKHGFVELTTKSDMLEARDKMKAQVHALNKNVESLKRQDRPNRLHGMKKRYQSARTRLQQNTDKLKEHVAMERSLVSRCTAPQANNVGNAIKGKTCKEGTKIDEGGKCTTQCKPGFTPSVESLSCTGAKLSPPTFKCDSADAGGSSGSKGACRAPLTNSIKEVPKTGACLEGKKIDASSQCTPRCNEGYTPSVKKLECDGEKLSPDTFKCLPNDCAAPKGVKNAHSSGICEEGDVIPSGKTCTAKCAEGFVANLPGKVVAQLECSAGVFKPSADLECAKPYPIPFPGMKRGIGIGYGRHQAKHWDLYDHKKVGWWFDWMPKPSGNGGAFDEEVLAKSNFVPMVKTRDLLGDKLDEVTVVSPYLMAFNEPYGPCTDMSAKEVTDAWPQLENKAKKMGKQLGKHVEIMTPSFNPKDMEYAASYKELMDKAGRRYDGVLMDFYPCTVEELKKGLDTMYALFKKPIWLKEFNCLDGSRNAPAEMHLEYMKKALPMLEAHPHVVRYSWMASTAPADSPGASLIDRDTDVMTKLGHYYNTAPAGA